MHPAELFGLVEIPIGDEIIRLQTPVRRKVKEHASGNDAVGEGGSGTMFNGAEDNGVRDGHARVDLIAGGDVNERVDMGHLGMMGINHQYVRQRPRRRTGEIHHL